MLKNHKKILSLALALLMAVSVFPGLSPAGAAADEAATFVNVSITSDSAYRNGGAMTYGNSVILTFESTAALFPSTKPIVEFQIGGRNVSEAVPVVTEVAPNQYEATFKLNFGDHRTGSDTTYSVGEPERDVDFGGIGGPVSFSITGLSSDGLDIEPVTETSDGTSVVVDQTLPSVPDAPVVSPTEDLEDPYWDDATYAMIEETVMDNIPLFLEADGIPEFRITDEKYASLIREADESGVMRADYTQVFKAAIADASAVGTGAKVIAPYIEGSANVYYTGAIHLLSNVNLVVEEGVTVMFLAIISSEYYPIVLQSFEGQEIYNYSPPIYAIQQENIAVTGKGTLNAQYSSGWSTRRGDKMALNKDSDRNVPAVKRIYTDSAGPTAGVMPETIPVIDHGELKWVAPPQSAVNNKIGLRPCFVQPYACNNIIFRDISLRGSPMWNVAPISCRNVLVDGLDINAVGIGNGDGVNPVSSQFVIIQNTSFANGDDCIAIKSYKNGDGLRRNEPSQYIIIRDCEFANGHGGVTCGSEISGGIRWVFAERNNFDSASLQYALRFKVNSFRGATIENIYERNSSIAKCSTAVLYIESSYTSGNAQDRVGDLGRYTPHINNVYISDFTTVGGAEEGNINCTNLIRMTAYTRSPINGIHIRDCEFYGAGDSTVESLAGWDIKNLRTSARGAGNPVTTINTVSSKITDVELSNGTDTVELKDTIASGNNNVSVIKRNGTSYTITGKVETEADTIPVVRVFTTTSKTNRAAANVIPLEEGGYGFSADLTIPEDESAYFINVTSYIGAAPGGSATANSNLNQTTAVHNVVFAEGAAFPPAEDILYVRKNGLGHFKTITEAVSYLQDNDLRHWTIDIGPGVFYEKITVKIPVTVTGAGRDATVISWNDGNQTLFREDDTTTVRDPEYLYPSIHYPDATTPAGPPPNGSYGTLGSYTLGFFPSDGIYPGAEDSIIKNLSIENTATGVGQTVALSFTADRLIADNIRLDAANNDTFLIHGEYGNRAYVTNSIINGGTDFIFGNGQAVIDNCEINIRSGGVAVAPSTSEEWPYGFLIQNSNFNGSSSNTYLARSWNWNQNAKKAGEKYIVNAAVLFKNNEISGTFNAAMFRNGTGNQGGLGNASPIAQRIREFGSTGSATPDPITNETRLACQADKAMVEAYTVFNVLGTSDGLYELPWYPCYDELTTPDDMPAITSVRVSTPTIVQDCSANLIVYVDGENLEGQALNVSSFGKTADVVNGRAVLKLAAADVSAAGSFDIVASIAGTSVSGSCKINVEARSNNIWKMQAGNADGSLKLMFAEPVELISTAGVTFNGESCDILGLVDSNESILLDVAADAQGEIVAKGVKYPRLFPSYSFTFKLNYEGEPAEQPVERLFNCSDLFNAGAVTSNRDNVEAGGDSQGNKYVQLSTASPGQTANVGDYIGFNAGKVVPGSYEVVLGYKRNTGRASLQLSVNGTDVGSPFSEAGSPAAMVSVSVGTLAVSEDKDQIFTFAVTSAGSMTYEYIRLIPII